MSEKETAIEIQSTEPKKTDMYIRVKLNIDQAIVYFDIMFKGVPEGITNDMLLVKIYDAVREQLAKDVEILMFSTIDFNDKKPVFVYKKNIKRVIVLEVSRYNDQFDDYYEISEGK